MITITGRAKKGLHALLVQKGGDNCLGLRLIAKGDRPGAYQAEFRLVRKGDPRPDDVILDQGLFDIYVDPESAPRLAGVVIDYTPTFKGPSFKIEFPTPQWKDPVAARVQKVLTERVNPGIASHGGYVTLLGVEDGVAYLSLGGGCQGCGLANVTIKQGVETLLAELVPEIHTVVDQTDHASGTNPYYRPASNGETQGQSPLETR